VLLVMALPRLRLDGRAATFLDAACAAGLLTLLFYLKLSYAAVGAAFVIGLLVLPGARRFAAIALAGTFVALLIGEVIWGATGRYISDARNAAAVSGAVRGGLFQLALIVAQNMHQGAVYGAALLLGVARRTRLVYLLASVAMAAAGLLLLNQNAQALEIPLLLPAALTATLAPTAPTPPASSQSFRLATMLLVLALVLPGVVNGALALRYFRHELAHPPEVGAQVAELDGVVTHEGTLSPTDGRPLLPVPARAMPDAIRSGVADTETMLLLRQIRTAQPLSQSEYLNTLQDGAAALRADPQLTGPIYTFDLQNPFNAMLNRRPPRGDSSWNHFGRTFNKTIFLPAEQSLKTVNIIMDPKDPMEVYSTHFQELHYADYIKRHYQLAAETTYWRIYRRVSADEAAR
jgi:hypothetical protein